MFLCGWRKGLLESRKEPMLRKQHAGLGNKWPCVTLRRKLLFCRALGDYHGLCHSHWPPGREVANSIYQILQCQIITHMNVFVYGEHHFLMKLNLPNSLDSITSNLPVDKKISQTSFMHLLFSHDLWSVSKYTYIISERHSWQHWSEQDPEWHWGTRAEVVYFS